MVTVSSIETKNEDFSVSFLTPIDDGDNGNQYLVSISGLRCHVSGKQKAEWCVIVGDWEFEAFISCAKDLLSCLKSRLKKNPKTKQVTCREGDLVCMKAIRDAGVWKIYVEFDQPPYFSTGHHHRWRFYPITLDRVFSLLGLFAEFEHHAGYEVLEWDKRDWCLPEGTPEEILRECRDRLADVYPKEMASMKLVLEQLRESIGVIASCVVCGGEFVRGHGESWKKKCLDCYYSKKL